MQAPLLGLGTIAAFRGTAAAGIGGDDAFRDFTGKTPFVAA